MTETILRTHAEARASDYQAVGLSVEKVWKVQAWGLTLLTFMSFFPRLFHIEEYLFFPLLAVTVLMIWKSGKSIRIRSPIDLPLWLFVGWVLVSVPFATDPAYSFAEWRKIIAQVLVFYWALLVLRRHSHEAMSNRLLSAVVIATALLGAYAITDFMSRGGTWRDRYVRAGAPYSDYNWLTTYMVIALPLLAAAAVRWRVSWKRILCIGVVLLALLAQAISYTRAGWLGMVAQGLSFGLFTARRRLVLGVLVGCLLLGGGLVTLSQVGYQRDTVDPWTLQARLAVWKLGFSDILEHPFVGVGYGSNTFMKRFAGYPETIKADGPHSTLLMVTMGSGVPALVFLIWIFVSGIRTLIRQAKVEADHQRYAVMIAVAVMMVGFATRNFFDYMFAGSLAYLFWMLVATGFAQKDQNQIT